MLHLDSGDLHGLISKNTQRKVKIAELEIWKATVHLLKALEILHSCNILHRDLKSANVFLGDGDYKLGDLNVSKVKKGHMAYTQTGTPYYASPEVWNDKPYDHKSDIWSLGCIIYEMCSLKLPFLGNDMQELNKNIQKCKYNPIPDSYSREMKNLVELCLQKNPTLRPSARQLLDNLIMKPFVNRFCVIDSQPLRT